MHAIGEDKLLILGGRDHTFQDFKCDGVTSSQNNMLIADRVHAVRIGRYWIIKEGKKKIKPRLPRVYEDGEECLFAEKPCFTFAVMGS